MYNSRPSPLYNRVVKTKLLLFPLLESKNDSISPPFSFSPFLDSGSSGSGSSRLTALKELVVEMERERSRESKNRSLHVWEGEKEVFVFVNEGILLSYGGRRKLDLN